MSDLVDRLRRQAETLDSLVTVPSPARESGAWRVESWAAMRNAARSNLEAASTIEALAEEAERLTAENRDLRSGEYLLRVIEGREALRRELEEARSSVSDEIRNYVERNYD